MVRGRSCASGNVGQIYSSTNQIFGKQRETHWQGGVRKRITLKARRVDITVVDYNCVCLPRAHRAVMFASLTSSCGLFAKVAFRVQGTWLSEVRPSEEVLSDYRDAIARHTLFECTAGIGVAPARDPEST